MKNFLDDTERQKLLEQHKHERDKRVCDRIKAVLLYDKGWSYHQIAEALLISHEAVRKHTLDYEAAQKLAPRNGGSSSKLNKFQCKMLIEHLKETTYMYAKDIVCFCLEEFGLSFTISGMTQWLKVHGFSYKKPAVVPGKADRKAQEEWIQKYRQIKENLAKDETICFMDGVHPTHNGKPSCGWIQKGVNKALLTNTGRQRINLSGAIDIMSKQVVVQEDEILNAETIIHFLKKLEESYPDKKQIYLFCDNAGYYRNKKVQSFLTTSKISMEFLPPYSPNLNPIERLWKLMNEHVINNKYYKKFCEFKCQVLGFFEALLDPPKELERILESRITDNFRSVGA